MSGAPEGQPVTVVATLDEPVVGLEEHPLMLDGPLSWAAAQQTLSVGRELEPMTRAHAPDLDLPLARWQVGGVWGWACSAATFDVQRWGSAQLRRKPATGAMARFAPDRKHHAALGPHKARDTVLPLTHVRSLTWQALTTDVEELIELLLLVQGVGKLVAHGYGHVSGWSVSPSTDRQGWRVRPMPHPDGVMQGVRAPYHHHSRLARCL